MEIKKLCQLTLIFISLLYVIGLAKAQSSLGQVLQINTHFQEIYGKPTWLLIVRDVDTGIVSPYLFDIRQNNNFWIAFTFGHSYRVVSSSLTFNHSAKIDNFCNLEDGILAEQSMYITLTGILAPDPSRLVCHIIKYADINFTVANDNE
jgi:hypothetical protein